MPSPESPLRGRCLCGAVRYSLSQTPDKIVACHCTHCQKASGSGASHNALVPSAAVSFTAGKPKLFTDTAASGNTHRSGRSHSALGSAGL